MDKMTITAFMSGIKNWVLGKIQLITALIPSQASSSNQLADKAFVNSSIATATATYRGNYNVVTDLSLSVSATHAQIQSALAAKMTALSIDVDNNDYAFVQIPTADATPTQIAKIEKYKYNGSAWLFEYELNNSGFTAAQWAAINSGATLDLIGKLSALPTNAELTALLDGKQNVIADLAAIRSGATAGASAVQPNTLAAALVQTVAEAGVFDLSKHNAVEGQLATYADLNAALTALNALPAQYKYGGMSIKFVTTSDNKYVQFRYMRPYENTDLGRTRFVNPANWQGADKELIVGSHNLIENNAVAVFATQLTGHTYQVVGAEAAVAKECYIPRGSKIVKITVTGQTTLYPNSVSFWNSTSGYFHSLTYSSDYPYTLEEDCTKIRFATAGDFDIIVEGELKEIEQNITNLQSSVTSINSQITTIKNKNISQDADILNITGKTIIVEVTEGTANTKIPFVLPKGVVVKRITNANGNTYTGSTTFFNQDTNSYEATIYSNNFPYSISFNCSGAKFSNVGTWYIHVDGVLVNQETKINKLQEDVASSKADIINLKGEDINLTVTATYTKLTLNLPKGVTIQKVTDENGVPYAGGVNFYNADTKAWGDDTLYSNSFPYTIPFNTNGVRVTNLVSPLIFVIEGVEKYENTIYSDDIARLSSLFKQPDYATKSDFRFLLMSDMHSNFNSLDLAIYLRLATQIIRPARLINCGDNVYGTPRNAQGIIYPAVEQYMDRAKAYGVFHCLGQHEVGYSEGATGTSKALCLTHAEAFSTWIEPMKTIWGLPNLDTIWWSKEFAGQGSNKTLLISLYQFNAPLVDDPNDNTKYKYNRATLWYGQDQIDWLINTLNSADANTKIIILQHEIETSIGSAYVNEFYSTAVGVNNPHADAPIVQEIIDAFNNRTTLTKTYHMESSSGYPDSDFTIDVDADFSSAQGSFLFYLMGDAHHDSFGTILNSTQKAFCVTSSSQPYDTCIAQLGIGQFILTGFALRYGTSGNGKAYIARAGQTWMSDMTRHINAVANL